MAGVKGAVSEVLAGTELKAGIDGMLASISVKAGTVPSVSCYGLGERFFLFMIYEEADS